MKRALLLLLFLALIPASAFSQSYTVKITVQNWQCRGTNCIENVTITADDDTAKQISLGGDWNGGRWCLQGDKTFAAHGAVSDATIEKDKVKIEAVDVKGKKQTVTFHVKSHYWEKMGQN